VPSAGVHLVVYGLNACFLFTCAALRPDCSVYKVV
jgi:hypothetical protein